MLNYREYIILRNSLEAFRQSFCHSRNWTDLHWAAYTRKEDMVKYLLENGADVNQNEMSGNTPLHLACRRNDNGHCISIILQFNPDINLRNHCLDTPLNLVVRNATYDEVLIGEFLSLGADPNLPNSKGNVPLHYIALGGQSATAFELRNAEVLIKFGADVNLANEEGDTPLHIAIIDGLQDLVELLVHSGANIEMKNNLGYSPVDAAALLSFSFPSIYEYIGRHYILEYYCRKIRINLVLLKQFIKFDKLRDFQNKCFMEYLQLKCSNIGTSFIKYSDLLTISPDRLAMYMQDDDFLQSSMNIDTEKYEVFSSYLSDNLKEAYKRYNIQKNISSSNLWSISYEEYVPVMLNNSYDH